MVSIALCFRVVLLVVFHPLAEQEKLTPPPPPASKCTCAFQAYHAQLTKLLKLSEQGDGGVLSFMPSDTGKAALDSVAESLDLSPEQVKPEPVFLC